MRENKALRRKDFIKSAVTGAAGFAFLGAVDAKLPETGADLKSSERKFIYRTLGKTGIKLPVISMGVMNANNPNLVRAALDAGIVHLDTAHGYQRGRNEEMIGSVIKGRPRDSFVIATKIPGNRLRTTAATVKAFHEKFDLSLKRLGLEYVDILYLHGPSRRENMLHEPFMQALKKLKEAGKTRFVGASLHGDQPKLIQAAIDSEFYEVVLMACNFKTVYLRQFQVEEDYFQGNYLEVRKATAKAAAAGLGVVAMKTLAGGYLDRERTQPVNAKAALKWVLQDPNVHTTIPGFNTFDQMNTDLSVMEDLTLTGTEKKDLQLQSSVEGLYCQGCEKCLPQCPHRLPIPDIIRAYMYTYGYQNLGAAQDLLFSLNLPANVCGDCEQCSVRCAIGFDISARIRDVVRLQDVPPEFIT